MFRNIKTIDNNDCRCFLSLYLQHNKSKYIIKIERMKMSICFKKEE